MRCLFTSIFLFFFSFSFFSCNLNSESDEEHERIFLGEKLEWAECDETDTVYSAPRSVFKPLDASRSRTLEKLVGREGSFVWIRARFRVPDRLKFKSLGLVMGYIHFADKVWLNDVYVGGYGSFPPDERSALWAAHCYLFPDSAVRDDGVNTILIKVWVHGGGDISSNIFVCDYDEAVNESSRLGFWYTRIFLICEGWTLCAVIIFLSIFIWRRKDRSNLAFALLNCSTVVFLTPFFLPEIPWYATSPVSYLLLIKSTLCLGFYFVCTFASLFLMKFIKVTIPKQTIVAMCSILLVLSCLTLAMPDYNSLMSACPYFLVASVSELIPAVIELVKALRNKNRRGGAFVLMLGFSPFLICCAVDFTFRVLFENSNNPYFAIFGWQVSVFLFLLFMSIRYNKVFARYEYLSLNLRKEVSAKTQSLSEANEKLLAEIRRNDIDLEMASIVQEKFFPAPDIIFRGWDIAICYKAAAKVSGDLYDYYHTNSNLEGISLFDVSGHGISSSLITMLAKHIVHRAFKDCTGDGKSVSAALYRINEQIIEAKGDIENYLTGILLRFGEFDSDDECTVEMANAGHPHPVLYSAADGTTREIAHGEGQSQYGAIGLVNIAVSFPEIKFKMARGDIFICYTDGLVEAMNKNREEFGLSRVRSVLQSSAPKDALSILEDLIDSLDSFTEGVSRDDDLTIIILKRERSNDYLEELMAE